MGKKLKKTSIVCYIEPDYAYNIFNDSKLEEGENILAFSAIGQPKQFYEFLKPYSLLKTIDFDDHHNYTQKDVDLLVEKCKELGCSKLVTTEKDAGKLKKLDFSNVEVFALKLKTAVDVESLIGA